MKPPIKIDDKVMAGAQPGEDDLAVLAKQGIITIINLRRAGESNQPITPEAEGVKARALGLRYVHLPISVADLRPEQVQAFAQAVERSNGPVYVHCGAGQRACAFALMRKADSQGSAADGVLAEVKDKGIDLPDQAVVDFIRAYVDTKR
ncbi:beta-lactamase hydrolase domain-containing protein [Reyranella sp.]|uniref:beta-lactamase hydrolase domain-containing protein n=1 Tax=Reyranella sp. TaxID=1929291 RepID=UPI002731B58F|nr:sulfur transferase domain-containing protein [Reyranella sp.]MDP2375781.1 sulfur transferase domain-containing protein [Reyranella sp.]